MRDIASEDRKEMFPLVKGYVKRAVRMDRKQVTAEVIRNVREKIHSNDSGMWISRSLSVEKIDTLISVKTYIKVHLIRQGRQGLYQTRSVALRLDYGCNQNQIHEENAECLR
ncbi:hypothetical protein chiPu_0017465 [Chiloscyllium punctatum]|uniref:Uncharacterized protein n=1 Tax=Chiloscyllium punctatum TaxID=137246 RepID=A0A401RG50_CHIPU|nr:hypothetical protein [Chiloscyllium punctatum]